MNPRAKYLSLDWIFFYFFYALMINVLISCMFKQNGFFSLLIYTIVRNAFHTYLAICNNSTITHKVAFKFLNLTFWFCLQYICGKNSTLRKDVLKKVKKLCNL